MDVIIDGQKYVPQNNEQIICSLAWQIWKLEEEMEKTPIESKEYSAYALGHRALMQVALDFRVLKEVREKVKELENSKLVSLRDLLYTN